MTPAQLKKHSPNFLKLIPKSVRDYWRTRADDLMQYNRNYYQTNAYVIESLTTHIHDVDLNLRITALWEGIKTLDIDPLLFIREFDSLLFGSQHLLAVDKETALIAKKVRELHTLIANSSNPRQYQQTGIGQALAATLQTTEMLQTAIEYQSQFTTIKTANEHPHVYFCRKMFLFFMFYADWKPHHELNAICASIAFDKEFTEKSIQRLVKPLNNKKLSITETYDCYSGSTSISLNTTPKH